MLGLIIRHLRYVADPGSEQCCGSGMFIPDPGSKNSSKREGEKKFVVIPFFEVTNFT
jgi:hypothetical protein